MSVELIYDAGCPNASKTRAQLLRAFAASGRTPSWQEWERSSPDSPKYVRDYASPTLLVAGRDVAEEFRVDTGACRLYRDEAGRLQPVPPLESIQLALRRILPAPKEQGRWKSSFAALPAIGLALLPKLTCAACWPAYAALLSALGLGFIDYTTYFLPLTATFLAVTLVLLGFRAKTRRGYGPLLLGVAASAIVLVGKFAFDSDAALYSGVALLIGASIWNAWPLRSAASCSACAPDRPALHE
jgi:mercuric ion transport protein